MLTVDGPSPTNAALENIDWRIFLVTYETIGGDRGCLVYPLSGCGMKFSEIQKEKKNTRIVVRVVDHCPALC